ncbi:MAG: glycosyltransferase [Sphingomonadaceae bacterium]|nr:glycosyltransferase [Sphingomonadaceae bacterium]
MRILSISTLFPNPVRPSFGNFVGSQMCAAAARDDVELTMISPIGIPPWPLSLREPYRSLREIPATSTVSGILAHYPKFRLIPKLGADSNPGRIANTVLPLARKLHRENPFDLIDASFFFPDGPAAATIASDLGVPFTIKSRGADIHYWGNRPRALAQMQEAASAAGGLLAVTEALKQDMAELGMPEDRIFIHYTGLDRERFKPIKRGAARALVSALPNLGIWPEGPLIVTPGALIARKGQAFAIKALSQLAQGHLALAGSGEDETSLRALCASLGLSDRVQFLGHVDHDTLPQLLCAADVVVLPSSSEGLANVWVEALACGTPIVIPDIGGARELVAGDTAGRIVERNPDAIAVAIGDILNNPPTQEEVAETVSGFSWDRNGARIVDIWQQVVASA